MSATPEEMAALRADLDQRKSQIEALEKGLYGVKVRNRKYVVDIDWPYREINNIPPIVPTDPPSNIADNPASAPYEFVSAPFVVDQGTRFYVKQVSCAVIAKGTIPGVGGAADTEANAVIPAVFRAADYGYGRINFRWKVRSTGSDRDWQNQFLPDWLLQSGSRNGLRFRRAQYCLVGGSEVTVTVAPVRATLEEAVTKARLGFVDISTVRFQFAFGGVEAA